jgi:hypothetical protein
MIFSPVTSIPLFFAMLLLLETGRRLSARSSFKPNSTIEGAVFALFGLLLAFTFSGAIARYDTHRTLINEEANDIGTSYLRLDLLPPAEQPALRELFRNYVTSRLNQYSLPAANSVSPETARLQSQIWSRTLAASTTPEASPDAAKLLLPALNDMFDITATRQNAFNMHPPAIVYVLLFALSCACALLAGFGMPPGSRNWLHMITFAAIVSMTIYATLDIEYPRRGLIRLSNYDNVFIDLRQSMK